VACGRVRPTSASAAAAAVIVRSTSSAVCAEERNQVPRNMMDGGHGRVFDQVAATRRPLVSRRPLGRSVAPDPFGAQLQCLSVAVRLVGTRPPQPLQSPMPGCEATALLGRGLTGVPVRVRRGPPLANPAGASKPACAGTRRIGMS